ncbi:uncharacterized protein E0L32_004607 [Thyridium curvatum]|uniref:Uncharacterized protein n=1 Tax=Thyridium curvatum TaxID=1093900 RepID=A0A507BFK4_9PEZI|nr:uncharacterized protein E0L32_004607 [Thyridium curvatum]TPX15330.1 hypothetical protein E0L32_004607 [Thyridium curvatum]
MANQAQDVQTSQPAPLEDVSQQNGEGVKSNVTHPPPEDVIDLTTSETATPQPPQKDAAEHTNGEKAETNGAAETNGTAGTAEEEPTAAAEDAADKSEEAPAAEPATEAKGEEPAKAEGEEAEPRGTKRGGDEEGENGTAAKKQVLESGEAKKVAGESDKAEPEAEDVDAPQEKSSEAPVAEVDAPAAAPEEQAAA